MLLALANQLNVLPADLNRLLIIVVVLSMVSGRLRLAAQLVGQSPANCFRGDLGGG